MTQQQNTRQPAPARPPTGSGQPQQPQAAAPAQAAPIPAQAGQVITYSEAPASINLKFDYRGANIQLTLRDVSGSTLLGKLDTVLDHLEKMGATFPSAGGGVTQVAPPGTPVCPDGHGPMKASTKKPGSFFCSKVVGTHPQTGKNLYCTHKVD